MLSITLMGVADLAHFRPADRQENMVKRLRSAFSFLSLRPPEFQGQGGRMP